MTMMAKMLFVLLVLAAAVTVSAAAFAPVTFIRKTTISHDVALRMGLFDFEPFHGSGSGKEKLDEQWEAQQAILRERRGQTDKSSLKKKYSAKSSESPAAGKTTKKEANNPAEQKPDGKGFFWEK